jgi:hypothetical protein
MPQKLTALAFILLLLAAGGLAWPLGQKMDIFVPVDALIAEKRYSEAVDLLRGLLVSAPARTGPIKDRIAKTELLQADADIASQRYNEALSALSLFWAQYPERADQAQKRIRTINHVREQYNKLAKDLLAFISEATNRSDINYNKEVARRIQELDDLDRNNPDSKRTIASLKETSLALINQDSMRTVMSAGRARLDAKEYAKAANEYLKGFSLFKPEFDGADYDELTRQAVANEATKAAALPASFEAIQAELVARTADLNAAFASGEEGKLSEALPGATLALAQLRAIRENAFAAGASLANSFTSISKEGRSPIEYQYMAYLDIFIRGRPDSLGSGKKPESEKGKPEGIGGAILAQTEELLDRLGKTAQTAVDSAYARADSLYDGGSYEEAQAAYSLALAFIEPAVGILADWSSISPSDFVPDLAALRAKIAKAGGDEARLRELATLAQAGARLAGIVAKTLAVSAESSSYADRLTPAVPLAEALGAEDASRGRMRELEAALASESAGREELARGAATTAELLGDKRPLDALAAYSSRLDRAIAGLRSSEYKLIAQRSQAEGDYMQRELAARTDSVRASELLIEGQLSLRPERSRAGYRDPSASSALLALKAEEPKIAALAAWISGTLSALSAEGSALAADPPFAAARARVENLGRTTQNLKAEQETALAKASQQKKAAEELLAAARKDMETARSRIAEAKNLVTQNRGKGTKADLIKKGFSDSKTNLDRGLTEVVESSNQDFFPSTWDEFQNLYLRLSADIAQAKKDYVINETFRLLAEGQTYYEQALFDLAGESLVGAQELWHEDNDTDQEQVKYWQNLVRQASDTNNKREVRQSDALYYEIGSYLSEARKYYLSGDGLMKSGRKTDAASAFDSARQNISFVTRAFPLNAEAGLLTLQILKSTDAEAYRKSLPRRIQEAVGLLDTDASSGYSRIADLYKMEPGYPGLKAILEKAEIKVGKRRAPPTKQELANAAGLVAEAEKLLKTGRKDDAARAESNLNAALTYDPANKRAFAMLRDLTTLKGKSAGPVLGLADQAILDQATRSFASSQYNQARDQLSQLLSDPNKRTRDVLKLDNDLKTLGY